MLLAGIVSEDNCGLIETTLPNAVFAN
jgi:hypothetical protein